MRRVLIPLAALALAGVAASPSLAQRWGTAAPGPYGWQRPGRIAAPGKDEREGKVEATRFVADSAARVALGRGPVAVSAAGSEDSGALQRATYEAAVIDRLAAIGYDTTGAAAPTQTVELIVRHAVLDPAEAPHKPVSGEVTAGVSNRGSFGGVAVAVDLRKPRPALLSTRLEARIRDKASGSVLWEGRADIATREGDPRWSEQAIATKLAGALFAGFPGTSGETIRGG